MPSTLNATTTNGLVTSADNSGSLQLQTNNGTTAVTIDTSQNVGVNTASPTTKFAVTGAAQFIGVSPAIFPTTGSGIEIVAGVSGQNNYIQAYNRSGSSWQNLIIGSGQTSFETSGTERMRIVSGGDLAYLCTGLDGDRPNAVGSYKQTNGNTKVRVVSDGTAAFQFYSPTGGGSPVGSISPNASSTTYATSSDYRLKENVAQMTGALAKVAQLKPCTYTWKADGSAGEGFIAHELQEVCPDAVIGEKDAVNEDGSIKPQGIDTSFLVATLTAAIQELKAELDATKAEVQALKGVA